jgi:RND family efflux transporter MFP subunit
MSQLQSDLASLRLDRRESEPPPQRRRWPWAVVAMLCALTVAAYSLHKTPRVDVRTVRAQLAADEQAQPGNNLALLSSSGYIVSRRKAVVSAKIQGRLAKLHVEEGTRVNEGDIIAELENADANAQLARAQASQAEAAAGVARAAAQIHSSKIARDEAQRQLRWKEKLRSSKVTAEDDVETARSKLKLAEADTQLAATGHEQAQASLARSKAEVDLQTALLNNTIIRAPFSGTVVKKMAEVGESVAPIPPGVNISTASGAIVALADLDTLEVEADVSEANVAKITEGQPARVEVEAIPNKPFTAQLRQILPTADRTKATVQVKVTILDKDPKIKPEMSARVTFFQAPSAETPNRAEQHTPKMRVFVPRDVLAKAEPRTHVFEVVEQRIRQVDVVARQPLGQTVVIDEGLVGNEVLVISPPPDLKTGDSVNVISSP